MPKATLNRFIQPEAFPWECVPWRYSKPSIELGRRYQTEPEAILLAILSITGTVLSKHAAIASVAGHRLTPVIPIALALPSVASGTCVFRRLIDPLRDRLAHAQNIRQRFRMHEIHARIQDDLRTAAALDDPKTKVAQASQIATWLLALHPALISGATSIDEIEHGLRSNTNHALLLDGTVEDFPSALLHSRIPVSKRLVRALNRSFNGNDAELIESPDTIGALWCTSPRGLANWMELARRNTEVPLIALFSCNNEKLPYDKPPDPGVSGEELWQEYCNTIFEVSMYKNPPPEKFLCQEGRSALVEWHNEALDRNSGNRETRALISQYLLFAQKVALIFESSSKDRAVPLTTIRTAIKVAQAYLQRHIACLRQLPTPSMIGRRRSKSKVRTGHEKIFEKLGDHPEGLTFRALCRSFHRVDGPYVRTVLENLLALNLVMLRGNRYINTSAQ